MTSTISATIEYGIFGYVMSTDLFTATSIDDLIVQVNAKTEVHRRTLNVAEERDGDLRQFTPCFANGYPNFSGCEAEFGDEFCGSIIDLRIGDRELVYRSNGQVRLRDKTGLH